MQRRATPLWRAARTVKAFYFYADGDTLRVSQHHHFLSTLDGLTIHAGVFSIPP